MNLSIKETIKFYFEKIEAGSMDFSDLRKMLQSENYEKEDIDTIIKRLDRDLIRSAESKQQHSIGKNIFYGGLILMTAGFLITILTYTAIIDLGGFYIIAYGPVLGGWLRLSLGK